MERVKFEDLVAKAVEDLPEEFRQRLENIDVVVEEYPSAFQLKKSRLTKGYTLLGLYEGIPLTQRYSSYGLVPPDKITLFQGTIEAKCGNDETAARKEIREVVLHEIAHHFGIGDARLKQIEDDKRYKSI
jgi:predicted Zn-dependent protease with MMP-like domain